MVKGTDFATAELLRKAAFYIAFSLFWFTPYPALAAEDKDASVSLVAVICIDPASGEESRLPLTKGQDQHCPASHTEFIAFEVERSPGADPLPFEPQDQKEQAEVGDAPMDQQ